MPQRKKYIKPYSQGDLDSFCGLYSVINSTKLVIKNISKEDSVVLAHECITTLELIKRKTLSSIFINGLTVHDVSCILKNVVSNRYPIKRYKPFHRRSDISIDEYWDTLKTFMDAGHGTAIICIEKNDWSHWTAVKSMTSNKIHLNDSDSLKHIYKIHCSTNEITKVTPIKIHPYLTFFLARNDIKKDNHR